MTRFKQIIGLCSLLFVALYGKAETVDYLKACWNKQVKPLHGKYFSFSYKEKLHELEHNFEPWQQSAYDIHGTIWINRNDFFKTDTLIGNGNDKQYFSKTQIDGSQLLLLDYGDKDLFPVTQKMFFDRLIKSARYMPFLLRHYFTLQKSLAEKESNPEFSVYTINLNRTIIKLFIRKKDKLVFKIEMLDDDELFGDVISSFTYKNYTIVDKIQYPMLVEIEKINGKLKDEVIVFNATTTKDIKPLLAIPANYQMKEAEEIKPVLNTEHYSKNIHFVELKHSDDKVMIVEFKDFLLVAEAPLNSSNGELIIQEARKIAPGKPIKYFVFGHHHPHYLGGLRPFIHKEATVLCTPFNKDYVSYIAKAPHTLNPDSLQIQPKDLKAEEIQEGKTITDGDFEMKIYLIGKQSEHTNDYLIYYFPKEKLVFEDDLVWIPKQGIIKKAGKRQLGLYAAIRSFDLDVKTIIQSWPVADFGVKTIIPFEDLEKSVTIK